LGRLGMPHMQVRIPERLIQFRPEDITTDPEVGRYIAQGLLSPDGVPPYFHEFHDSAIKYLRHIVDAGTFSRGEGMRVEYAAGDSKDDKAVVLRDRARKAHQLILGMLSEDMVALQKRLGELEGQAKEDEASRHEYLCLFNMLGTVVNFQRELSDFDKVYDRYATARRRQEAEVAADVRVDKAMLDGGFEAKVSQQIKEIEAGKRSAKYDGSETH